MRAEKAMATARDTAQTVAKRTNLQPESYRQTDSLSKI